MNTEKSFDELREIEENAGPRLSSRYGHCPVCQLTAIHFRTAQNGTLIACCSCGAEWPSPILMFTDWLDYIERGPDAAPPNSARFWVDGGDPDDDGDSRAELLRRLAAMREHDAAIEAIDEAIDDSHEYRVAAITDHEDGPITERAPRRAGPGVQTSMKTKRITLTIDVPVSADVLTAGLDPQRLCPELPAAQERLAEAERQLESARADIQQRKKLIKQHAGEMATRGTAAVDDFEKESVALKRAEMLLPMWERNVVEAKRALEAARVRAVRVSQDEVRQRQAVLDAAAAQLFTALEELADLEDALAARAAQLPAAPSEGVFSVGSIRHRLIVMAR